MGDLIIGCNIFRVSGQVSKYNWVLSNHTGIGAMENSEESHELGKIRNIHEAARE